MTKLMILGLMILFVVLSYTMSEYTTKERRENMSFAKQIAFDLSKFTLAIIAGICLANLIVGTGSKQNFLMLAGLSALIIDYLTNIIYAGTHLVKNISR